MKDKLSFVESIKNYNLIFLIIFSFIPYFSYSQCNHTISLFDDYGDGWNGATVTVYVNGSAVLTDITLGGGYGPADFTFSASTGDNIQVTLTNSGGYPDECYFDVKDVNGDLIVNDWWPYYDGNTWTGNGTGNCVVIMKVPASGNNSYTSCSGNLYDSGGPSGNYSSSSNGYTVLYPLVATDKVRISGTTDGENCCDYVRIYNGVGTGGTVLGTYYMDDPIPTLTSTDATGALTVRFVSDGSVVGTGFNISISCYSPCGVAGGTSSSSVTSSCATANTTLSLSGEGAGTIQWQQSTDGGSTWSNIPGATTDPFVYSTNTTALLRAAVTNGCTSYSTTSSITFSCPDIIHPSSGTSSTTIQCGGSYTYRDPGNTNNYGNDQNGLITICPSTPGQYVNVNFTSFNTEGSFDYFYVFDGYDAHAPLLGVYDGNGALSGNVKATSSNSSGCLSFRFYSDGATVRSGWEGTVTCSGTPSAIVPTTNPEDCQGAIVVCGDENLFGGVNSSGYHELPDPWNYCIADGENQSTWYAFSPATSGTIAFEIIPDSPTDYDWAVWGPYTSLECPAFNNDPTLRCSSSQLYGNGNTGLLAAETDTIEQNGQYAGCCGADGDGFLKPINAQAGEIYVLMLDNWDVNSVGFELHWNLTNGATLDCSPVLPVNLVSFTSLCDGNNTILNWVTETETNNDYFALEKSDENFEFYEIGRISGKGNSNITNTYTFTDKLINENTSYYRLKQVDFDGKEHYHRIIASNCFKNSFDVSNLHLTDNKLDMIISSSSNEEVIIYLYSSTGRLIAQQKTTINSGNNKFSLNDLNVNSGIYFVGVVGKQNKFNGKIIKE